MRDTVKPGIEVVEVDAHINDAGFAEKVVEIFGTIAGKTGEG